MTKVVVIVKSDEALRRLRKFAASISPDAKRGANQRAGIAMHSYVMRTFDAQGAYNGAPAWEPLKAGGRWSYVRQADGSRKRGQFDASAKLLQDTGALRQSFAWLYDEDAAGVGAISGMAHADIAERHQFGDPSSNLPPRPMLPPPEAALKIMTSIYGEMIRKGAQA